MRRAAVVLGGFLALGAVVFWLVTAPETLTAADLPDHVADAAHGEDIFNIGGCASCHAADKAEGDERLKLGGGLRLATPFGVFVVPNISPDSETGIGGWTPVDFANSMLKGVSPQGAHYYPAFPYGSYAKMRPEDVLDLWAYLQTLPAVSKPNEPNELSFPFNVRRGIGLWKLANLSSAPVAYLDGASEEVLRGQYLVEGPGHCAECHTRRDLTGALDLALWMAGGPNPDGKGTIPNITPHERGLGGWSESDIAYSLESGFTPDFDTLGGSMAAVVRNTSRLSGEDRSAIAAYLRALPPLSTAQ